MSTSKSSLDIPSESIPTVHAWLDQDAYHVPKHPAPIDLALYANERSWYFQQDALIEMMHKAHYNTIDPNTLQLVEHTESVYQSISHYPHPSTLEKHYAQFLGLFSQQVLLTAGGDEGLSRIFRAFLDVKHHAIIPTPTFPMLHRFARWCHADVVTMDWLEGDYPYQQVIDQVNDKTRLVVVVSPNNPTGLTSSTFALEQLIQQVKIKNPQCLIIFDGAYIEFADLQVTDLILSNPHCIMIRTLSKAFGLAGLRMGFILGHPTLINHLRAVGLPYPVSHPSLIMAHQVLTYFQNKPQEWNKVLIQNKKEREWLSKFFKSLGAYVPYSEANFIYVDGVDTLWWRDMLAGQGIGVRIWPQNEKLKRAMRISCPCDSTTFTRVQNALLTCIAPQALLFDVDGVLVDVSQSYRSAIIQTAAYFGVKVTASEIDVWKSKGEANNDWIVTHSIIQAHNIEVSLAEVTEKFEDLYQNDLWQKETLLAGSIEEVRQDLQTLSQNFPLALVTGRPRKDLVRFLDHFQISSYFTASVCMNETESKPSADPIILALKQLEQHHQHSLHRAWLIGDTPDDVLAARACHKVSTSSSTHVSAASYYSCIPFAVATDHSTLEQSLWTAGCARIITSWRQWIKYTKQHCIDMDDQNTLSNLFPSTSQDTMDIHDDK